jgi:diacylglycerol kinase
MEIVVAIAAAVVYALTGYFKSVKEEVDMVKAVTTVIIGVLVGVVLYVGNIPVTAENVAAQMLAYAGLIVLVENIVKGVYRRFEGEGGK